MRLDINLFANLFFWFPFIFSANGYNGLYIIFVYTLDP